MARSAESPASLPRPRWVSAAWLRITTLGPGHAAAWALFAVCAIGGYAATLDSAANAAEELAGQQLARTVLARAEGDFKRVAALLDEALRLPHATCSPEQIDALNRLDFDINEIKEFGVFDDQGRLSCTSRTGVLATPYDVPLPDAQYGETRINVALMTLLSEKRPVYVMRRANLNALIDARRWLETVDGKAFGARLYDRQTGKEVLKVVDSTPHPRHYSAEGEHFSITVDSTGEFAQQWQAARKVWVLPALGFAGLCAALVFWQLVTRARSPLSKLERIVLFKPKNIGLVYQPIVGIDRAQVVGAEALLRLRGNDGSVIPPGAVFGVLETQPVICQRLTAAVLERGLDELKDWLAADRTRFLAVNVTQHDLESSSLPGQVRALLKRNNVRPEQLHLELLETSRLGNEKTLRVLQALRDTGCQLWIDDFGVGYSNLARLHTLPVHGVKLDREWVEALDDTQHVRTDAVMHLVLFAGSNGLGVVAEGVSDELAMRTLLRLGVQKMQGFLFAPGLPLKDLLQLSDSAVTVGSPKLTRKSF